MTDAASHFRELDEWLAASADSNRRCMACGSEDGEHVYTWSRWESVAFFCGACGDFNQREYLDVPEPDVDVLVADLMALRAELTGKP